MASSASSTRRSESSSVLSFRLGGTSEAALRKLLGVIATSTSLVAHDLVWMPAVG